MKPRRLLGPLIFTSVMFLLLIALGVWQLKRLAWKENLLAEIATASRNPPQPLAGNPPPFTKLWVEGRWDTAHQSFYGTDVRRGQLGAYLIEPLLREGAPPLLVDRGFIPDGARIDDPSGLVRVVGYARAPEHSRPLGISDDPAHRHFYALDPAAIAAAIGLAPPEPFVLMAMGPEMGPPEPAHGFPDLPNNHLSYALTWFSFAVIDWVVFLVWWRRKKEK